jgi:hypothetical protein
VPITGIDGVANQIARGAIVFGAAVGTSTAGAFTLSAAILAKPGTRSRAAGATYQQTSGVELIRQDGIGLYFQRYSRHFIHRYLCSGAPIRPVSPTPFPVNLTGWLTQTTAEITGPTGFTLAGGSLGRNGSLRTYLRATGSTTSTKTFRAYLGSTVIFGAAPVGSPTIDYCMSVVNQGSETLQTAAPVNAPIGIGSTLSSFAAGNYITVDTTVDQAFSMSLQVSSNTASAILLNASVTLPTEHRSWQNCFHRTNPRSRC